MNNLSFSSPLLLLCGAFFLSSSFSQAATVSTEELAPLRVMFAAQSNVKSLSADFTQIRALRTLRSPLLIKGKLWFQSPNEFRWELGTPPKTILIGTQQGIIIIHPSKKQAEKRPPSSSAGSLSDSSILGMMHMPGEGNIEDFQKKMQVLSINTSGSRCHIQMLPKDPAEARGLASINFDFDQVTGHWLSFELVTRDGSSLINEFSNVRINPIIPREVFVFDLSGFKVTDEKE